MYRWRKMTEQERESALEQRKQNHRPWHNPPHLVSETSYYLVTAACFEHRPIIGLNAERMGSFEHDLLTVLQGGCRTIFAWIVLPNHYHVLVDSTDVKALLRALGQLHGRTSYDWNCEENRTGRKVWFNAAETAMKSERHFWATLNYVLHNAFRHGYVSQWTDWPYSNAADYLQQVGQEHAIQVWKEFPILDYGAAWDPPDL